MKLQIIYLLILIQILFLIIMSFMTHHHILLNLRSEIRRHTLFTYTWYVHISWRTFGKFSYSENVQFSRSFQMHYPGAKLVIKISREVLWTLCIALICPQNQFRSMSRSNVWIVKNALKQQFLAIFSTKMCRNCLEISIFLTRNVYYQIFFDFM